MRKNFPTYPSLSGQTVFISGGASGIGAEMVAAFAAQGSNVGFLDIDQKASAALVDATEGKIAYEICDLRDIEAMRESLGRVLSEQIGLSWAGRFRSFSL